MQAYDTLAEWFEYLNDDCGYPKWSQYFLRGLRELGAGERGLELGCGSGYFSRALTREGFRMTAGDLSQPMLSKGARLAAEEGINVEFLRLDARRFSVRKKYDFVLAANDVYNYLPPEALAGAFRSAANALRKGGIFWFDVSSPCKLRGKVADTVSVDDRDEVTYLAFNRLLEDHVEMEVSLFVRGEDGRYTRSDETHVQYLHEKEAIEEALAGFEVLREEGHLGGPWEGSDRWNFICRKV